MILVGILGTFLIFFTIIFVHEAGHFFAARLFGMQTPVVGLGLPFWGPTYKLFTYKDIEFRFHWVLFGAYVAIPEMDDESAKELETFNIKLDREPKKFPVWQRVIVSLAGPAANVIFALILSFVMIFFTGVSMGQEQKLYFVSAQDIACDSIKNNLKKDDLLLKLEIQNKITEIHNYKKFIKELRKNKNKNIKLHIKRENNVFTIDAQINKDGFLGIELNPKNINSDKANIQYFHDKNFAEKISIAWEQFAGWFVEIFSSILMLLSAPFKKLSGQQVGFEMKDLGGIIRISNGIYLLFMHEQSRLIEYWALLSVNIGLVNLVPMLPLDGGHILFQLSELFFGTHKNFTKIRDMMMQAGLVLILALTVFIIFNDVLFYVKK